MQNLERGRKKGETNRGGGRKLRLERKGVSVHYGPLKRKPGGIICS